ncbi:MAG: hypothetical protein GY719_11455 [bacterium]|nr:hypothetical protein [bacterium]
MAAIEGKTSALSLMAEIDLGEEYDLNTVEVSHKGGGVIELPGPRTRPVRPHLEIFAGPGGAIGRLVRGDGRALPTAVLLDDGVANLVALAEPPAVLSRSVTGGFWVLSAGNLRRHADDGAVLAQTPMAAQDLVADESGGAWAVTSEGAVHVSVSGSIDGPRLPWPMRRGVTTLGDAFCGITLDGPPRIRCLTPDGAERRVRPENGLEPLEQLVALGPGGDALVASAATVRLLGAVGGTEVLEVHGAGLGDGGEPFVSRHIGSDLFVTLSDGSELQFAAPADAPSLGVFPVVCLKGGRSLAYAQDRAVWFDEHGVVASSLRVDGKVFRDEVFSQAWRLAPVRGLAARNPTEVLISVSGPGRIVVIAAPIA